MSLLPEPPRALGVADVEAIFDRKLREWSKQKDVVGKVSALTPLTVKLRSGDVPIARRNPGVAVAVGDQVQVVHDGAGYVLVGRLADVEDPAVPESPVPVGGLVLWPAANPIPDGWEEVTALRGRFVVSPDGVTFVSGTTGGAATHVHATSTGGSHDHTGSTGAGTGSTNRNPDGAAGTATVSHDHSIPNHSGHTHGNTVSGSTLPPYSAAYIWIRRVA